MHNSLTNGFAIRGLNADCDRLAMQSSEQTTWPLGRKRDGFRLRGWHEVGILQNEVMALRAYSGAAPEFEIKPLGDRCGVLILQLSRGPTFVLRVGQKRIVQLDSNETCMVRCEWIQYPHSSGVAPGAYGSGLRV